MLILISIWKRTAVKFLVTEERANSSSSISTTAFIMTSYFLFNLHILEFLKITIPFEQWTPV